MQEFNRTYEEPFFKDKTGSQKATEWLVSWANGDTDAPSWLVILGEYGTGKTALTRIMHYRWLENYLLDSSKPFPIRIELRNFSRQFDARSLLHHFLDTNGLGHVPIDFILHLIRQGSIILILDGYDEMAQFLNLRERRACLSALADLSSGGAKGLLTSRPNYFTEAEELHVFEALYRSLQDDNYFMGGSYRNYLQNELIVDSLVEKYVLDRYERVLRDLNDAQTEALVKRKLSNDLDGQSIVLSILKRVFRDRADEGSQSLSGKPIIITYLLELIDVIKSSEVGHDTEDLTEWLIYKMIVDQLMLRDQQRAPTISPSQRRDCLQLMAISVSRRDFKIATEESFYNIIDNYFVSTLRSMDAEQKNLRRMELFEDLRSSSTLTRIESGGLTGWGFSHNSLREYLVAEYLVAQMLSDKFREVAAPITDAMKAFASSLRENEIAKILTILQNTWMVREQKRHIGQYLSLMWSAFNYSSDEKYPLKNSLIKIGGGKIRIGSIRLSNVVFDGADFDFDAAGINAAAGDFSEITFLDINLRNGDFTDCFMDSVRFINCDLSDCRFDRSILLGCEFINCKFESSSFKDLSEEPSISIMKDQVVEYLDGQDALGYFRFYGADTDDVEDIQIYRHHPKFAMVSKIVEKLCEQSKRQLRGLTQRGEAHIDPPLARKLVNILEKAEIISVDHHELVSITAEGRKILPDFVAKKHMPALIKDFFIEN